MSFVLLKFSHRMLIFHQIAEYTIIPDSKGLSEKLHACLQDGEENPRDFTSLFNTSLFNLSCSLSLPHIIR